MSRAHTKQVSLRTMLVSMCATCAWSLAAATFCLSAKCTPCSSALLVCVVALHCSVSHTMADVLASHGLRFADVFYVHLHLRDMALYRTANQIYNRFFDDNPPAR